MYKAFQARGVSIGVCVVFEHDAVSAESVPEPERSIRKPESDGGAAAANPANIRPELQRHESNTLPTTITIDQSGANTAGIESYNVEHDTAITVRQIKYLNNIVEQDHRAVKRIIRPMLGFKSFRCARIILAGIEIMHMICKGQMRSDDVGTLSAAQEFYSLAV